MEDQTKIIQVDIEQEMKKSYIDYAMSVIVGRALPDVRDGLKPVHRRILYAMNELGLSPEKPHRKSARIVGDVLGKYHPHGDTSVYDAMVRMAQDFSIRYLLVNGHGNFGSVDGDGAAAMRYTEAKMQKLAVEMLRDIEKETVDFAPNFDETLKEPKVLPSRFPNLLVNGSNGIAVGMATSIPPHNLGEVIDATVKLIDDKEATVEDLIQIVKGPDFPTGATIMGKESIKDAYRTGQGKVTVRANVEIEDMGKGKSRIIATEIPYQVNKARLIEKIADLVRDKKIEGISDLRDESDRNGMRIVVELKRDVNANIVLNKLYKHTQLQDTFSIIMIALVNGQPKILNLYELVRHYLEHQKDVVTRRTQYDLRKAEDRAHILEGLKIALDNIDEVISLIRSSANVNEAREGLMSRFGLTEVQAKAILDMRLQKLTGLERGKIEEEYEELIKLINKFREILANEHLLLNIIREEILEIKEKYNDPRRTAISFSEDEIDIEDLIDEEDVAITLTHLGYIKRIPADTYKSQRRGGKGITGLTTREEDFVERLFITSTHNYLLFFTNRGRVYRLKAYEIPEAKRQAKGTAIVNLLQLNPSEKITAVIPVKKFEKEKYLIAVTRNGIIKKTDLTQFDTSRKSGLIAISLRDDDELISVKQTNGDDEVIIVSQSGKSIRFSEKDVRDMGRAAMGVKAMSLDSDDIVVAMELIEEGADLLVVSQFGFGKRTDLSEYKSQNRGGKGLLTYNVKDKTGHLVGAKVVTDTDEIMLINTNGVVIRLESKDVSIMGRHTQGVTLMRVDEGDSIVSIAKVANEIEEVIEE
ncbi:DNA gyrase subunit A [Anaeromicrobium sediminis]|uniref:DNA gyrase subunit A n=1 Tax=Anaeromicrobium sediminis TaxID=1478221 RepID=UPI00241E7595